MGESGRSASPSEAFIDSIAIEGEDFDAKRVRCTNEVTRSGSNENAPTAELRALWYEPSSRRQLRRQKKVIDAGVSHTVNSVAVIEASPAVTVPAEADATFKKKLDELLFTKSGFQKGEELTLTYRFVQFDEGSRFKRWVFLGVAGEGRLPIEVVYSDMSGKELGKIMSEVKIGSLRNSTRAGVGFYGGSSDDAIERAAKDIADYSVTHFK